MNNITTDSKLLEQYKKSQQVYQKAEGLSLEHKYVRVNNYKWNIHYYEIGEGKPLILIHGAVSSSDVWYNMINLLKKDLRLIIIDLPSSGLSEKINYREISSYREHIVTVLDSIMDKLNLEKASILGNSLGGLWTSIFTLERPQRVDKVGYIGKPVGIDNHFPFIMSLFGIKGINQLLFKPTNFEDTIRTHKSIIVYDASKLSDEYIQCASDASMIPDASFSQRTIFEKIMRFMRGLKHDLILNDEMKSIKHPIIFIWGDKDGHGSHSIALEMQTKMSNIEVKVIKNVGHMPWLESPKETAKAIRNFFK